MHISNDISSASKQRFGFVRITAVAITLFGCGADDVNSEDRPDGGSSRDSGADDSGTPSSSDASLVELSVVDSKFEPIFTPDTLAYTATIPISIVSISTSTTLTARPRDPKARIAINGEDAPTGKRAFSVSPTPTPIEVTVTASDGHTTRRYSVVTKAPTRANADYTKASNTRTRAWFGASIAMDGNILVVGSPYESSNARGIDGNQADMSAAGAGAVYVFEREPNGSWAQRAYIKASNCAASAEFGINVGISGDTLIVGAPGENGGSAGVNGDQASTAASSSGAAYIFVRNGKNWTQQAYVKASNPRPGGAFGRYVAISGDTVAVGSIGEKSGVVGNPNDTSADGAGAAYVFSRTGTTWAQCQRSPRSA